MGDNNEFDIYDDLDVFDSDEKQQEKGADYLEIRDQLKEAQEVIRRLQEENENLREQIVEYKKTEGTLEQNASSLLITARAELKRKEQEIRDLRKEKDNILFRRRDKLKKNVQTNSIGTQSQITCKPFLVYELKRVDVDAPREVTRETAAVERNHRLRGDENQTNNPFAKSKENNNENKANHKTTREYFAEKNGNHRQAPSSQQLRHQDDYNLRGKHMNQRSRDGDERTRDQSNVERSKRRRSRSGSPSKDRKRARRSRSREQQQRRHRNNHERSSPEKPSRNQRGKNESKERTEVERVKNESKEFQCDPKRSANKPESEGKHSSSSSKRRIDENISTRHSSKVKSEPDKLLKQKEKETKVEAFNQSAIIADDNPKVEIKHEDNTDETITTQTTNYVDTNGDDDALEEGEIDEQHGDEIKTELIEQVREKRIQSQIFSKSHDFINSKKEDLKQLKTKPLVEVKSKIEANSPEKTLKNEDSQKKISADAMKMESLPVKVDVWPKVNLGPVPAEETIEVPMELEPEPEIQVDTDLNCHEMNQASVNRKENKSQQAIAENGFEIPDGGDGKTISDTKSAANEVSLEKVDVNTPTDIEIVQTNNDNNVPNVQQQQQQDTTQEENGKPEIAHDDAHHKKLDKSSTPTPVIINDTEDIDKTVPSQNISINLQTNGDCKQTTATNGLPEGVLNTSGYKSVKNISTSSKDYLIVENENNETTIYVTRKKKKKKKKSLENV